MPGFEQYVGLLVSHEPGATPGVEHIAPDQLAFNTADQRIFARFGDDVVDITDGYSRHTVDQLLDAKASSSELAKVATTGVYADLKGKPSSYPPSQHTHTLSQVTDAGTAARLNAPTNGDATSSQVVKGDDTRLSDSRPPTSHQHSWGEVTGKPSTYPPSQHTHTLSQVTDAGTAAASDVADFEPRGSVSAAEARIVHRIDQRPDPLLMHFL
jgi:hypothetical protein